MCQSMQSTGKLQLSTDVVYDFTSEDLQDLGEIGRGGFGTVNKMIHRISNTVMAVKVSQIKFSFCSLYIPPNLNYSRICKSYLNYVLENSLYCGRKRTKATVNGFRSCDEIERMPMYCAILWGFI